MPTIVTVETILETGSHQYRRNWFALHAGHVVAVLLAAVSIGGLTLTSAYARETHHWATQALAQDWFDLLVAAPSIAISATFAAHGSRRARIVLAGLLLFTTYTLAIYCFAIHLNALFLVYCATLGASLYALIPLAAGLVVRDARSWFEPQVPRRTVGGVLVVIGVAFGALWLSELVAAARSGTPPREIVETGVFTNPIHVLDLSFILPLYVIAGIALLRRRSIGFVLAPALLAFGALMAASIAFLMIVLEVRGVSTGGAPVAIAMTGLAAVSASLLAAMLRKLRPHSPVRSRIRASTVIAP